MDVCTNVVGLAKIAEEIALWVNRTLFLMYSLSFPLGNALTEFHCTVLSGAEERFAEERFAEERPGCNFI